MGMLKNFIGGKNIAETEAGLDQVEKGLEAAEAKIVPFINKVTPVLPAVLKRARTLIPELQIVSDDEINELGIGLAMLPGLFTEAEKAVEAAKAKLATL